MVVMTVVLAFEGAAARGVREGGGGAGSGCGCGGGRDEDVCITFLVS